MDDNPGDIRSSETLPGRSLKTNLGARIAFITEGLNNSKKGLLCLLWFLNEQARIIFA